MKQNKFQTDSFYPVLIGFICFLTILIITQFTAYHFHQLEKEKELQKTELLALTIRSNLEELLNHGITATKLLETIVKNEISFDIIGPICEELILRNPFIDALQIVKDRTIIFTYPIEGNEITIGYKILEDTIHLKEAVKAYNRNNVYFEGPLKLIQGSIAIIGRFPIIKNDSLWGFSAVIIKEANFLNSLNSQDSLSEKQFDFYLTKYDSTGKEIAVVPQLPSLDLEGIFHHVDIPYGDWVLTVVSRNSNFGNASKILSIFGILLSISFGLLLWYFSRQPYTLKRMVNERTLELNEVNKALNQKAEELERSNKDLEQFAYIASHDLQEPSRMVSSFLERLQIKYASQLDEKANKYIHFAVQGSKRMLQIIRDLLEFSKLGYSSEKTESVDLNELFSEIRVINSNKIKTLAARIEYKKLPTIQSNYSLLLQVIQNLIENALKYRNKTHAPVIKIDVKETEQFWEISVKDNGIGIDAAYFDKIFLIFQRLHSDSEYKGTGIGLSIVKKIIDGMNGQIWLESEVSVGTTFYIKLPK